MKNVILNSSVDLIDPPYPSGQKTAPKNAAHANTWAIIGDSRKRFIWNLRRTFSFNHG